MTSTMCFEQFAIDSVVFFPDRVSKLRAPCTKCTVLYSEKITENKADSSAYSLSTVM